MTITRKPSVSTVIAISAALIFAPASPASKDSALPHINAYCSNGSFQGDCKKSIRSYFEPQNLSSKATLTFDIDVSAGLTPHCKLRSSASCSPADVFYCEQAIWEAAPFAKKLQSTSLGSIQFSSDAAGCAKTCCSETYFEKFPSLKNKVVVLHLIPASAPFRQTGLREEEIPEITNLLALPLSRLHDKGLSNFRSDWVDFFNKHPEMTKSDLISQAKKMRIKYHALFLG